MVRIGHPTDGWPACPYCTRNATGLFTTHDSNRYDFRCVKCDNTWNGDPVEDQG